MVGVVSLWFGIPDVGWLPKVALTSSCGLNLICPRDWTHTREVVSPKRPNLILSADIPNIETCVLVRDGLDVEADSGNGVDFACGARRELEGVKDSFRESVVSSWL